MTTTLPNRPATTKARAVLPLIYDCASNAWDEVGGIGLGDFGHLYREDLDDAGRELIRPLLIQAWRKRGFRVRLIDAQSINRMSVDPAVDPPTGTYWEVWQEAAAAVHSDDLLAYTDLTDEYTHHQD